MIPWRFSSTLAVFAFVFFAASFPASALAERVTVFAAASMTNAMAEVKERFEASTGHELIVSHAGSSALARQIQQGAPADVFISANPGWMDVLEDDGMIGPGSRIDLLNNSIVLIAHGGKAERLEVSSDLDLAGLVEEGRLAMALVDAVPAGIYGKSALESLGLWSAVEARVAQTDNVRSALALVARGEASYGIVYATDAVAEDRVTVIGTFPGEAHPPVLYPAAIITGRATPETKNFMAFLRGLESRAAFERQGFVFVAD